VSVPVLNIVTVLIVILLSMLVTRFATIALTLTGMSRQAAKFQARSALTGAGYTTTESESVVNHPVRRRIVLMLMLFGSAGIVTVLASVMLTFANTASEENRTDPTITLLLLVAGIAGLLLLMNLRPVDRAVSRAIRALLRRYSDLDVRDYAALLEIHGGYAVSELQVDERDWIAGHSLQELRLMDEGVIVLGVQRAGGTYVGAPTARTRVYAGDVLLLYGHGDQVADLDVRERGERGEHRHAEAKREHASAALEHDDDPIPDDPIPDDPVPDDPAADSPAQSPSTPDPPVEDSVSATDRSDPGPERSAAPDEVPGHAAPPTEDPRSPDHGARR
jgi:hypothetical protein